MESPDERDIFAMILAQNPRQLSLILNRYEDITGQSLKSLIKEISRGDSRECLLALSRSYYEHIHSGILSHLCSVRVVRDCPAFFAYRLHQAFTVRPGSPV